MSAFALRECSTVALAGVLLTGCAVKPPLRYVAPDGTSHDAELERRRGGRLVGFESRSLDERQEVAADGSEARPHPGAAPPDRAAERPDGARIAVPADDPARAHYATAVGLQAACHHAEALAHFRGYLEEAPDGEFAGRALVRMAEIHLDPGFAAVDPERARVLLEEVVARFAGSGAAAQACAMLGRVCGDAD